MAQKLYRLQVFSVWSRQLPKNKKQERASDAFIDHYTDKDAADERASHYSNGFVQTDTIRISESDYLKIKDFFEVTK